MIRVEIVKNGEVTNGGTFSTKDLGLLWIAQEQAIGSWGRIGTYTIRFTEMGSEDGFWARLKKAWTP